MIQVKQLILKNQKKRLNRMRQQFYFELDLKKRKTLRIKSGEGRESGSAVHTVPYINSGTKVQKNDSMRWQWL